MNNHAIKQCLNRIDQYATGLQAHKGFKPVGSLEELERHIKQLELVLATINQRLNGASYQRRVNGNTYRGRQSENDVTAAMADLTDKALKISSKLEQVFVESMPDLAGGSLIEEGIAETSKTGKKAPEHNYFDALGDVASWNKKLKEGEKLSQLIKGAHKKESLKSLSTITSKMSRLSTKEFTQTQSYGLNTAKPKSQQLNSSAFNVMTPIYLVLFMLMLGKRWFKSDRAH
ncbi:hypothetical protein [Parendozoicomonas haliclonae]|uniref:Uncharacterized protein n=1 Tax=Parendozoicomonas haliclonae TaxID=1960125 RepID=A0A1X7AGG4_9GAMM|nr:hypothetical protein [Parendozoicomonas haliclonae]SMA38776.1 hypothetical protein EHSB41UT_00926 [Parendozoicomonas haliclonae]